MTINALVIGGSGFIGMHLLRTLKDDGRFTKVVSIDLVEPFEKLDGYVYETVDARSTLPDHLADSETIIFNLPALRTFPGHPDEQYFATNLGTTEQILDLATRAGVRTLVFTSTMSVYATGDDPKTENSEISPHNAYGASKVEGEAQHRKWLSAAPERRLIICRPAVIFGFRDNGNFTRLANALRAGYFVFVGRKDTIKSAGYVGDLTRSLLFAVDRQERCIVYNFAYPERLTIAAIVESFGRVGSFTVPKLVLPGRLLALAALPFELLDRLGVKNPIHRKRLEKLYESTNIVPRWLQDNGFEFQTTLDSALTAWRDESPDGRFI